MYAKVYTQIFDSSLRNCWQALVTFMAMLVLADPDDEVDMTVEALVARTGLPPGVIAEGIAYLEKPDPHSRSSDHEGRRILRLDDHRPWGWFIVNRGKYKRIRDNIERREYMREYQRARRASQHGCQPQSTAVNQTQPQAVGSRQEEVNKRQEESTPSAPRSEDASPVVFELPLRDGTTYPVRQSQVSKWTKAFPDVLIVETLRQQLVWLESNPARRKTRRGIVTFITSWLNREQNTPTKETAYAPRLNGR